MRKPFYGFARKDKWKTMGKILFSPLGKTDPISNMRDGSMLHICRIYKPDKVYLYMSKEILQDHWTDNRYLYCLDKLGEKIKHSFEVQTIERPDLINVHKLDDFYDEFSRCLQQIPVKNGEKILLNVSSGTPAMKMTLQVLAGLHPDKYIAIQVESPAKASNKEHEDTDHYDVELQWEYNLDNNDKEFEDRSSYSETSSLFLHIQKENIKRLIQEYDYSAALMLAESMQKMLSEKSYIYMRAAERRNLLDISGVQKILGKDSGVFLDTIHEQDRNVIEYLLNLEVKIKKKQYADYIRAITPVILDVFLVYLRNNIGITEENFCKKNSRGIWYIDINTMKKNIPKVYEILKAKYKDIRENPLSSEYVSEIIINMEQDFKVKQAVSALREVEKKVRNYAAHEIVAITAESIQKDAGMSPEKILEFLNLLAVKGKIRLKKEYWKSYDLMNEKIINEIDRQV